MLKLSERRFSLDYASFLKTLLRRDFLIIQDVDGVCMGLVRDPLTRRIERRYVEAAAQLAGHFYVLTNGEHAGRRGLNPIVLAACPEVGSGEGAPAYLPGLAAGGVQWQGLDGQVSHPGVSPQELRFLSSVPETAAAFLRAALAGAEYTDLDAERETLISAAVLDNPASPTINLNPLHVRLASRIEHFRRLQDRTAEFMQALIAQAEGMGFKDSFFIHYAPNLGRDEHSEERVKYAVDGDAGTTDFQFMLRGAVKEAGVLALLNRHYFLRHGHYPLGEDFNARQAPRGHEALLALAREHFDPQRMPCLIGVGDTVTSQPEAVDAGGTQAFRRGGSDRGFLHLVQDIGRQTNTDSLVLFVDSSAGEVRRPGMDAVGLRDIYETGAPPWDAVRGITDPEDPLHLNLVFPGGHPQYVSFFCELAAAYRQDRAHPG